MVDLKDAYVIGQDNLTAWSNGFDKQGYLKVLPHPDQKIAFGDPYVDWQKDHQDGKYKDKGITGNYYSSWGPDRTLEVTLNMDELLQGFNIPGLGLVKPGNGYIEWLNKATPYDILRAYNGMIPGPMLITEPGDILKIKLVNNLDQVSNLHTHGLHVSPAGNGDNVLIGLKPGESWDIEIPIPDNHSLGTAWFHPHLHGETNEQVGSGLGGLLIVNPPHDLPDLKKWDVRERPMHFMAINSFGIQQIDRPGQPGDPLNTDTTKSIPAGTPLKVLGEENGNKVYELSDAPFVGYNAKPSAYDPAFPTGSSAPNSPALPAYGEAGLAEPVENVIHTVNGQYNPTLNLKTGEWNLFSFGNFSVNSFHKIQLVKEEADGSLTPQEVTLVAIDGYGAGIVEDTRREVNDLPILNPGSRVSIQHWFEKPGKYYFLSNATEEILGDDALFFAKNKGFNDGHLIWNPQVLATIEVTGEKTETGAFPEVYNTLTEQNQKIKNLVEAANNGQFDRERTFTWTANIGGAIQEGRAPDDTEVKSFEGTYKINGEYYSTDTGGGTSSLTMSMLGTTEIWNIVNASGVSDPKLAVAGLDIPLIEWHPFHIHQNDFVVLEINGIPIENIKGNYLAGVLSDTIALPPAYKEGTVTPENPYGEAQLNGKPSEVKILMKFEDFPGSYVNHCHILFHEDAGMMGVVRVILNTENTWLGLGASSNDNGYVELFKASDTQQNIQLNPYGKNFMGGIDLAIADVNYNNPFENKNVTDNVTDVVTIQRSLKQPEDNFTVKVFDGATLFDLQKQGKKVLDGEDENLLIKKFNPFQGITFTTQQEASVASGDIDGDGFADIVVGLGGGISPQIEVYSGKDYKLISRIDPFHHETFTGNINLAVGDANGDNFDDIIVGQGSGGRGLVEVYSGISIDKLVRENPTDALNGRTTSHETPLLSKAFQPYGASYTGEVEVTSGYILQTPEQPNGAVTQTNNANITTLAVDDVLDKQEKIKVHTLIVGHHESHSMQGHQANDSKQPEIRVDKEFTPDYNLQEITGTFADVPGGKRGQGVLFGRQKDGNYQLIYLPDANEVKYRLIESQLSTEIKAINKSLPIGTTSYDPRPSDIRGTNADDTLFGANSDDKIYGFGGNNTIYAGEGNNWIFAGNGNNNLYAGAGNDYFDAGNGNNTIYAGEANNTITTGNGNDLIYAGASNDIINTASGYNSIYAGEGNNTITSSGIDTIYTGSGRDTFKLDKGTGEATIYGFGVSDMISLGSGFKFNDITISQVGGDTQLCVTNSNDLLATLKWVQSDTITNTTFA